MRRIFLAAAALAVAGCSTTSQPKMATQDEVAAIEGKFATYNDKVYQLHRQLTEKVTALQGAFTSLDNLMKSYEIEIRRLNERMDRLAAAQTPNGGSTPDPVTPADPAMTIEQALRVTEAQMLRLKQGTRQEDVAQALLPIAKTAVPKLCEALKTSLRDIEYLRRLEFVLSKMPVDDLKIPIGDALKDGAARYAAVRVIGDVGDLELSKMLEPQTSTDDLEFSYSVGYSLVRCKNRAGVPALIRALRSDDKYTRTLSLSALRGLNKNEIFGYDAAKGADANAAAVKAWEDWYEKAGEKLFE